MIMGRKDDAETHKETWFERLCYGIGQVLLRHWPFVFLTVFVLRGGGNDRPPVAESLFLGPCIGWYGKWLGVWWKERNERHATQ